MWYIGDNGLCRLAILVMLTFGWRETSCFAFLQDGRNGHLGTSGSHRFGARESVEDSSKARQIADAEELLERARSLRAQAQQQQQTQDLTTSSSINNRIKVDSPWSVATPNDNDAAGYRLYFSIGREEGSWMDPRWGSSGKRIDGSVDIAFSRSSNQIFFARKARLRGGFDAMVVESSGELSYRFESPSSSSFSRKQQARMIRFAIPVEGTPETGSAFGDVWIPKGLLYFSLPAFGGVDLLSTKEGVVSVRQYGWHTGWRREESRIVGTFRMKKLKEATASDGF